MEGTDVSYGILWDSSDIVEMMGSDIVEMTGSDIVLADA